MLILERAITHKHWSVIRDQILKKLSRDKFQRIKNTEVIRIDNTQNTITYTVLDGADPVAWLYLYKKRTWYTWEVLQVFVLPSHRGKKLASTLYQAAVNCDNIMISSGESQTKSARAMWYSFVKNNTFNIWAQNFKDLSQTSSVLVHDGELFCALPVYEKKYHHKSDVRLVAIRK